MPLVHLDPSPDVVGPFSVLQASLVMPTARARFHLNCWSPSPFFHTRYKYTLNVGSNGYANKLKYLFLCGSVVIWVRAHCTARASHPSHPFLSSAHR